MALQTTSQSEPKIDLASGVRIVQSAPLKQDGISRGSGVMSEELLAGGFLFMKREFIAPNAAGVPHYHPHETAIFMLEGRVRVDWGYGDQLEFSDYAEAGNAILIPAGAAHRPANEENSQAVALVVRNAPEDIIILVQPA